ncbi:MAG: curved DNA-binding protein [Desulforhopalus sp.]|jgi:curved DNA-binding protein
MKDYYKILELSPKCTEDEIRKNYRKLAMRYHPDRNPEDPAAEEKFKEVAEAYGVLTDPVKRREFNRCRAKGTTYNNDGFSYNQEDILKDLFKDPRFQQMFTGLLREFQKSGFRHSSQFVKKSFFGGKGGFIMGGMFLIGSVAKPLITGAAKKSLSGNSSVLKSLSNAMGSLLGGKKEAADNSPPPPHQEHLDITYHTPLLKEELQHGKVIQVVVYGEQGEQTLKVSIPPGSHEGQKLRLKGKGRPGSMGRGDLYLQLVQKEK